MLGAKDTYDTFVRQGISLFAGVPDSLMKGLCTYLAQDGLPYPSIITANEGGAIALAAGHHLATGGHALVYMQNSGLGNAVNPLLSLADDEVYGIPMLLLIGWRGEPGTKDEPQHVKQGRITPQLLDAMEIPYWMLDASSEAEVVIAEAAQRMRTSSAPTAILVRAGTFRPEGLDMQPHEPDTLMTREEAISILAESAGSEAVIVSTTGMASRELYEYRVNAGHRLAKDFLTVGAMGHSSQIALGIAMAQPEQPVYCLDGDGALLMHMGALAITGQVAPKNYFHVVLNNGTHDSVGGQPTAGLDTDFRAIALATGYRSASLATSREELLNTLCELRQQQGPILLEIRVKRGARADLGRPKSTPKENRDGLMKALLG